MFEWIFGENENKNNNESKNQNEKKDVYTYFNEPTPLQKRERIASEAYRHHHFSNSTNTPTLRQGEEFKRFQKKIKKEVKKNQRFITEGFGNMNTNSSQNISENNEEDLIKQYNDLLGQYVNVKVPTNLRAGNIVQQMNQSNPYFKQNILFSTGQIAYVTEKGVVKRYLDTDTFNNVSGQNNCPSNTPINVNIPWDPSYTIPGTTIPTTPPLMSGTPIEKGQICGNEDTNIYVNEGTEGGKMGYVNPNGVLSVYPDSAPQLSTDYTTLTSYDNSGNDLPNSIYGNASDQMCQDTCNKNPDCYGYVFDLSTSYCYPKDSSIYPKSQKEPNPNRNLNLRNKVLPPGTAATNRELVNVNSNDWSQYVNSGKTVPNNPLNTDQPYGFNSFIENFTSSSEGSTEVTTTDPVQQNILSQLEDRINLLSKQIAENTSKNRQDTQSLNEYSSLLNTDIKQYIEEYDEIKKKLDTYSKSNNNNVSNILKESDLLVTNRNYVYFLYAILLLGVAIVALKVINNK